VEVPAIHDVQVLDISVAGVLFQLEHALHPGTRGCLRLNLWGAPFAVDLEVSRVAPFTNGRELAYQVGARFVAITPEHRQLLEQFASQ
jgi:hypothetical protein